MKFRKHTALSLLAARALFLPVRPNMHGLGRQHHGHGLALHQARRIYHALPRHSRDVSQQEDRERGEA